MIAKISLGGVVLVFLVFITYLCLYQIDNRIKKNDIKTIVTLISFFVPLKTFNMADTRFEHCIEFNGFESLNENRNRNTTRKIVLSLLLT
jgi:hypothetical protein